MQELWLHSALSPTLRQGFGVLKWFCCDVGMMCLALEGERKELNREPCISDEYQ